MKDRGNLEFESIENLLERAFAPIDPPEQLYERIYEEAESMLTEISQAAVDEIADWELAAMSDPRNWARPAVALAAGSAAAGALVLLGLRRRGQRDDDVGTQAVKAMSDAVGDAVEGAREEIVKTAREEIRRAVRDFKSGL